jgi:type I restriction enzyme S subunit
MGTAKQTQITVGAAHAAPLPDGWRWVRLGEVCEIIAGQSPPGSTYRTSPEGLPFFQGKADFGKANPVARVWCVEPTKIAQPGDILISVRAPVGPTNVADVECCIGRGLAAIRCGKNADSDFILNALRHFEATLVKKGSGSTFEAINRDDLESFTIPLPPLPEQRRIAGLLREQMAAVEKARTSAEEELAAINALPAALLRRAFAGGL